MADIRVVSPDGERGSVPESEASAALGQGFKLEKDYDRDEALKGVGPLEKVLGGAEAFARGATFGLSDVAGDALSGLASDLATPDVARAAGPGIDAGLSGAGDFSSGFEQARQDRLTRREALGDVGTALELAGNVAPTLLSGGAGLGAKALGMAPAALAEKAGAGLAGRIIGDQAAAGLGRTVAGRLAGSALEGALGSGIQTGTEVAPHFVDDPGAAAEAVLTSAGTGLAIGAAAGTLFGLGEGLLRKGADSVAGKEAAQAAAAAAPPPPPPTADEIVAASQTRPLTSQLPDPPRDKVQALLDRQNAALGGYEQAVDQNANDIYKLMRDQDADLGRHDLSVDISTKREVNNITAKELSEEATDVLDQPQYDGPTFYHASKDPIKEWHGGAYDANFSLSHDPKAAATYLDQGAPGAPKGGYVYEFQLPKGTKLASEQEVLDTLAQVDPKAQFTSAWDAIDNRPDLRAALTERGFDGAQLGGGPTSTISLFSPQTTVPKMTGARKLSDVSKAFDNSAGRTVFRSATTEPIAPYNIGGAKPQLKALTRRHVESRKVIRGIIDEMNGYRAGMDASDVKGIGAGVRALEHDMAALDKAARAGDTGEMYHVLDQRVRSRLWDLADGTDDGAIRERAIGWANRAKDYLEDENTWGQLAQRQKLANPTKSDRITKAQVPQWKSLKTKSLEKNPNGLGNAYTTDSNAVRSAVSQIGAPGSETLDGAIRANVRAQAADAVNAAKAWGSPEDLARAERIAQRAKLIEDHLDKVAIVRRDFDAATDPNTVGNALLKGLSSVPVVGGVGAIATRVGIRTIAKKGNSLIKKVSQAATNAVKTASKGAGKAASVAPLAAAALTPKQRDEMVAEARDLQSLTSSRSRALLQEAAALAKHDPQLAEALVTQKALISQYITSKLPQPASQAQFAPAPTLDKVTARKLDRTLGAIANPQAAVERMGTGTSSPEDLDVVKTLFPKTYAQFTQAVAAEMAKMKVPPSLQQRLRLGRLTGLNVDASLERIVDLQKQAMATTPGGDGAQVPKSTGTKAHISTDQLATRADQILAGNK